MAAALRAEEGWRDDVEDLIDPLPLYALHSDEYRRRTSDQLARQAHAANADGEPGRAAALFEQANRCWGGTHLLISATNMRLRNGEAPLALAAYWRLLRGAAPPSKDSNALQLQLSDAQRAHVQRKLTEAHVAFGAHERAASLLQARMRLLLHRLSISRYERIGAAASSGGVLGLIAALLEPQEPSLAAAAAPPPPPPPPRGYRGGGARTRGEGGDCEAAAAAAGGGGRGGGV